MAMAPFPGAGPLRQEPWEFGKRRTRVFLFLRFGSVSLEIKRPKWLHLDVELQGRVGCNSAFSKVVTRGTRVTAP